MIQQRRYMRASINLVSPDRYELAQGRLKLASQLPINTTTYLTSLKTAFVINAKNNLTIFAENDVNINTDDGGESERVCFGVIGCSNFSFSGLNSIRHAQTFRPGQQTQLSSRRKFGSVSHARVQADT